MCDSGYVLLHALLAVLLYVSSLPISEWILYRRTVCDLIQDDQMLSVVCKVLRLNRLRLLVLDRSYCWIGL